MLCLYLLLSCAPVAHAFSFGQPYHAKLEALIENDTYRDHVSMMVDHYLRTDETIQKCLREGLSAVFLFEGCSDNMDHPDLSDLSYYRVSAVCLVIRLNDQGEPYVAYFNDESSTLPDRPLEYGAWSFPEAGDVGPATVCDGTYELYSVLHGGKYEALHMRTSQEDATIPAVYMQPEGYVRENATEINMHTRTGNHVIENAMWSAGCMLVGGGDWAQFSELIECTYYAAYEEFELERKVGCLTINRQLLKEEMVRLYENPDAVDMILAKSRWILPERYLNQCEQKQEFETPVIMCVRGTADLMTLPCANFTDARSVSVGQVTRGLELIADGQIRNSAGNTWYTIPVNGEVYYLYQGYAEESSWKNWITRFWASRK